MASILIVTDGKAGHQNQSLGLAEALARLRPSVTINRVSPMSPVAALVSLVTGRCSIFDIQPDLLVGAGRGTHLTLLALRRCYQVPAVVLMKPSLPSGLFNLCLIPEHDDPPEQSNVIPTIGALNRMWPGRRQWGTGVILVGGPSKNSSWDEDRLLAQIQALVQSSVGIWKITTSRRTPATTLERLRRLKGAELFPVAETAADWLPRQLAETEQCWVTEDSVSMVYEALTAGCSVGLLDVPRRREGRLHKGLVRLKQRGWVTPFENWQGGALPALQENLREAERCATLILEKGWL